MRERKLQIVIKNKRIYARTTYVGLDGKRHAIWRKGKNRTEAKDNLKTALEEKEIDGSIGKAKKTFAELADWYTERYLVEPVYRDGRIIEGRRSYQHEKYMLRAIGEHFGGYKLRTISHGELEKYKQKRLETKIVTRHTKRPRTIASVNRELMLIRALLRKAQKEGWLLRSPFEEHDSLINMADERRREQTLSYEQEKAILAVCVGPREHLRPIIICALATGMRRGEIFKLTWHDVNLPARFIRIQSMNTKTLQERLAPITEPLAVELSRLYAFRTGREGERVFGIKTQVKRSFAKACELAKIKHGGIDGLTFHCLRHTAATRMVKQGMDIAEVARILGHSQITTTYRYVSADTDILEKARMALGFRPPLVARTSC